MRCSQFLEGITELALGRDEQKASEHVTQCAECAKALVELKMLVAGFRQGSSDAPSDVVRRACEIPLQGSRSIRLVRTSLKAAGARGRQVESFQAVFESEGIQVRAMYTRLGNAWNVMAVVAPPVEQIEVGGKTVSANGGQFEFEATDLDQTGFRVVVEGHLIHVPSGSLQLEDGSN
jgi:hypothetical protein